MPRARRRSKLRVKLPTETVSDFPTPERTAKSAMIQRGDDGTIQVLGIVGKWCAEGVDGLGRDQFEAARRYQRDGLLAAGMRDMDRLFTPLCTPSGAASGITDGQLDAAVRRDATRKAIGKDAADLLDRLLVIGATAADAASEDSAHHSTIRRRACKALHDLSAYYDDARGSRKLDSRSQGVDKGENVGV